jgi:hypothetical protein
MYNVDRCRCVDGPNLGGCVKPANIELTDFYQPAFPFNSIQHPAIEIPKVAYPALCYSTLQLVHVTGQISAFKADIDIIYTSDHGDLNVTVSEIEDKGATIFLQVCCKEFGCFSVGSLQTALSLEVGHTFSLHDEIIISVVSCPLLTELQFGSVSCSGNEYRDICTLKCNYGYTIRDHVFSTDAVCGADGRWHGSHSTCLAVDCGDFPVVSQTGWSTLYFVQLLINVSYFSQTTHSFEPYAMEQGIIVHALLHVPGGIHSPFQDGECVWEMAPGPLIPPYA